MHLYIIYYIYYRVPVGKVDATQSKRMEMSFIPNSCIVKQYI